MNNFEILGVPINSNIVVIKERYKKLVKIYHPDKTGNDERKTKMFIKIKNAYEALIDGGKVHDVKTNKQHEYGKFTIRNIKRNAEKKKYLIVVSLKNIMKVCLLDSEGYKTGYEFTIDLKNYDGALSIPDDIVKKHHYNIKLW